jgi:hypothetical protein
VQDAGMVSVFIVLRERGRTTVVFANTFMVNVTVLYVEIAPSTFSQVLPVMEKVPLAVPVKYRPLYCNIVEEPGALVIASMWLYAAGSLVFI